MRQRCDHGIDQGGAAPFVEFVGDDLAGRGYCDVDGHRADLCEGLRLFLCDPLLGETTAALQHLFEIVGRLRGQALRLGLGMGDDRLGLRRTFALLELIGGEKAFCLLAQVARRIELFTNTRGPVVE